MFLLDGKNDFAINNEDELISVSGNTNDPELVISCRTTRPDVEVKLFLGDNEVSFANKGKSGAAYNVLWLGKSLLACTIFIRISFIPWLSAWPPFQEKSFSPSWKTGWSIS